MWRSLAQGQFGSAAPAPGPLDEDGSKAETSPGRGGAAVRGAGITARIRDWAESPGGSSTVRQLRWAAPSPRVLVARVGNEMNGVGRASDRQILEACAALGVPVTEDDRASWGPGQPDWRAARRQLGLPCTCALSATPGRPRALGLCRDCGGAVVPGMRVPPAASCPWCTRPSAIVCPMCLCGIHFHDECSRWLCGAHRNFAPGAHEALWLCPDCCWAWAHRFAAEQAVQATDSGPVDRHMRELAAECTPGAGVEAARSRADLAARGRARRWLSARLRSAAWMRTGVLIKLGVAALSEPSRPRAALSRLQSRQALSSALELLHRERRIWLDGAEPRQFVRWARGESRLPARANHVRARRHRQARRRNYGPHADEPPARRRRVVTTDRE